VWYNHGGGWALGLEARLEAIKIRQDAFRIDEAQQIREDSVRLVAVELLEHFVRTAYSWRYVRRLHHRR
jgi:hypothetical protein